MILPQRKSIRLTEFNYSSAGCYFITICTTKRISVFGNIRNGSIFRNGYGNIAYANLVSIPKHVSNILVDTSIVMPNHIHMILRILDISRPESIQVNSISQRSKQIIPKTIQFYKSSVTRMTHFSNLWQRGYYDHVIRDEADYLRIWEYIDQNPIKWEMDEYFASNEEFSRSPIDS